MKYNSCILAYLFLTLTIAKASFKPDSTRVEFDFTLRERFESWSGMNAKNYGNTNGVGSLNDKILFQRIVAGFTFKPISKIDITAHIQDSRAFGWSLRNSEYPELFRVKQKNTKEPYYTMNPNEEFFEIYDAYFECRNAIPGISFKMGRQKISYGDNRVFGPGEWGNTGSWTWDALKISFKSRSNFLDVVAGGTKTHDPEKISIPFNKTEFWGGGLYAHYEWNKIASIEPFYAIKKEGSANYATTLDFTRQWIGVRLFNNDFYYFVYDFTANKEFGNENGKSIDAFGILAKLGYQFNALPAKPILAVRESYASGGKNSDSKVKTFNPVYGSRDQYYGRMNITSWSNLDDREIALFFSPVKDFKLELNYHLFYIPATTDASLLSTIKLQPGKHHLGDEFNIYASYHAGNRLQMVGVFGYFWAGDVQSINGARAKNSSWFALQANYRIDGVRIGKNKQIN